MAPVSIFSPTSESISFAILSAMKSPLFLIPMLKKYKENDPMFILEITEKASKVSPNDEDLNSIQKDLMDKLNAEKRKNERFY